MYINNDKTIAKKYIEELFRGNGKITAFCKFNDCTHCFSSTKLFERVKKYHESDLVQTIFNDYSLERTKVFLQSIQIIR